MFSNDWSHQCFFGSVNQFINPIDALTFREYYLQYKDLGFTRVNLPIMPKAFDANVSFRVSKYQFLHPKAAIFIKSHVKTAFKLKINALRKYFYLFNQTIIIGLPKSREIIPLTLSLC
jgi:hypothetical protein